MLIPRFNPNLFAFFWTSILQIQHPRSQLNRFDLVITPRHDYYPLTPQAQEQVPRFLRRWITPREPPDEHVVCTIIAFLNLLVLQSLFPVKD